MVTFTPQARQLSFLPIVSRDAKHIVISHSSSRARDRANLPHLPAVEASSLSNDCSDFLLALRGTLHKHTGCCIRRIDSRNNCATSSMHAPQTCASMPVSACGTSLCCLKSTKACDHGPTLLCLPRAWCRYMAVPKMCIPANSGVLAG